MHIGLWAVLLSFFWILLSGYIQPLLLGFGAFSVFIVIVVVKRMDDVDQELNHLNFGLPMLKYTPWLLKEIIISSLDVTKLIWSSPENLSPTFAKIPVGQVPPKKQVLFASSITLTPGTLCVDLEKDEVTVHALQASSIETIIQGEMQRKITKLWGGK